MKPMLKIMLTSLSLFSLLITGAAYAATSEAPDMNASQIPSVAISMKEDVKSVQSTGVITSIRTNGDNAAIQIQDIGTGGIVLNVSPQTTFQMLDGTKLMLADLHVGLTISADHSMAMTMSLPPQTSAFKITVLDKMVHQDTLGTAGIIEAIREDGSLLVKGEGLTEQTPDEIVLQLSANTAIVDGKGVPVDKSMLVKGANIIGFYGPMMTKSIPPISNAWKIVVEEEQE